MVTGARTRLGDLPLEVEPLIRTIKENWHELDVGIPVLPGLGTFATGARGKLEKLEVGGGDPHGPRLTPPTRDEPEEKGHLPD